MKITNASYRIYTCDMPDVLTNKNKIIGKINQYVDNIKTSNAPATAPANFPRIIASSKDGMFNIVISNQSIQFDCIEPAKANDPVIFSKYMEIVDHVGSFFEDYSDAPFNYCGFSLQIQLDRDEINDNPTDFVSAKIANWDSDLMVDNAMVRKCFIQGNYFINLSVKNDKQLKVTAPRQNARPTKIEVVGENLLIDLDINDKYGFLNNPEYLCEIEQSLILCEDVQAFYENKLADFVKNGSFDFFR